MMEEPGVTLRTLLRAMLMLALLWGGGAWDRQPDQARGCCCGELPVETEDACPCPKPNENRGGPRPGCAERQSAAVAPSFRRAEQGQRRVEPRPEPAGWAAAAVPAAAESMAWLPFGGRDPDLGRHLSRLSLLRI